MTKVTAFLEAKVIARGSPDEVKRRVEEQWPSDHSAIRVYEDGSGRVVDLDYWDAAATAAPASDQRRVRGRPRLGVAAREVTLLPRHWEWLARQNGGASAALRRLVEEARGREPPAQERRDAVYRFLSDMCGDRQGYEEALRTLYRGEREAFLARMSDWPEDVRAYTAELLG
ncbi:MAG TPA: DUF2239 family protein [Allosphingosinicella sp.]